MPVQHMVWIKFNPEITPERIEQHLAALAGLKESVPGIQGLWVGENFTDRSDGFTHGLLVTLPDRAALDVYAKHPNHVAVAGPLKEDATLRALDIDG